MFFAVVVAVLCALVMGIAWLWRGMPSAAAAAVLWFCYALYEFLVYIRLLCSGDCGIRVDLLLAWPVLLLVTAVALKQSWRPPASASRDEDDDL